MALKLVMEPIFESGSMRRETTPRQHQRYALPLPRSAHPYDPWASGRPATRADCTHRASREGNGHSERVQQAALA